MDNEQNDKMLAAMLDKAIAGMVQAGDPFAWFEERGISREAALDLAALIQECAYETSVRSAALAAFVAGYSMHEAVVAEAFKNARAELGIDDETSQA